MKLGLFTIIVAVLATNSHQTDLPASCKIKPDNEPMSKKLLIVDCIEPIDLTSKTLVGYDKGTNLILFQNVYIKNISKDAFTSFPNLDTILIKDSKIDSMDLKAFDLSDLATLTITDTTFKQAPLFRSTFIEELILTNCGLQEIPNLDNLESLSFLNVANNNISVLNASAFSKVLELEELNLTNNSISELPGDIFNSNTELNTLTLDNNPLKVFKLNSVSNLESLSLKSCKLTTFDEYSSTNLDVLTSLDLSNNEIALLPNDALANMLELTFIDLSNNQLQELSENLFVDNIRLEKVVLDGNKLNELPKFQSHEKFPTYFFSCNNCSLKIIDPQTFENMPSIATLRLANNDISNIEEVFDKLHVLKELDLSHNSISLITPKSFSKNTALETLNLANNPLKAIDPNNFRKINALKKLDLSNTNLTQVWLNRGAEIASLERLLIGGNKIQKITEEDLMVTPNIKLLDLEDNPLECSDDLKMSLNWLIKKSVYTIQGAEKVKTHDNLIKDASTFEQVFDQVGLWKELINSACDNNSIIFFEDDEKEIDENYDSKTEKSANSLDSDYDDYLNEYDTNYYDEDNVTKKEYPDPRITIQETIVDDRNINLARASYILSVTSVFVLTALMVLTVAVSITLVILRKHGAFNRPNGNLPHLKIPLWSATPGQKKHSGSVYKPLSEDLSGPKTPMINRYEFKQVPTVHNSIP